MRHIAWRLTAMAVAVVLSAVPVAMDGCLVTCAAGTHATGLDADPPCHHQTASTAPAVNAAPRPCGHDHHGIIALGITDSISDRAITPGVTLALGHLPLRASDGTRWTRAVHTELRSPLPAIPLALSTALRI